jgi:hypothetical protein
MEKDNGGSCNAVNETREETTDARGQLGESWQSIEHKSYGSTCGE